MMIAYAVALQNTGGLANRQCLREFCPLGVIVPCIAHFTGRPVVSLRWLPWIQAGIVLNYHIIPPAVTPISGTVYEGDWVRGVREGHGKITFKDGSYYRGDMQKNQMWGHGIFVGKYILLQSAFNIG